MAVINVYDTRTAWPAGTKIKSLRILQLLPCAVPTGGLRPHETGQRIAEAGDSVVPCRWVLGTVPVEEDGSAHFTVPAYRELFFQALDERGMAVTSMRSATSLRDGEKLVCPGCHEPKSQAPQPPATTAPGPAPPALDARARRGRLQPVQLSAPGPAGARPQLRAVPRGEQGQEGAEPRPRADRQQVLRLVQHPRATTASPPTATATAPGPASSGPAPRS